MDQRSRLVFDNGSQPQYNAIVMGALIVSGVKRMPKCQIGCTGTAVLLLFCLIASPADAAWAEGVPDRYAGWAMEAYPEQSIAKMEEMIRRQVEAGANIVWIGHNNPGEVDAGKVEPGLSYAVYEAVQDPADPRHEAALAIVGAQHRMLSACRAVGVRAVLPVGYQIQMGQRWNEKHPDDVRRDSNGDPLDIYGGGVSASFYAASYRRDIRDYYAWFNDEFVEPYADVLLMINLADEPIGGDYSASAEAEFRRRHGFGFAEVGNDSLRQQLLGEFQSRYVVEYAAYSAGVWQEIRPELPVTMSFDGGQARKTMTMPDVEALFRDTPANFVVTFDAYPHDGHSHVPLTDKNLVGLYLLARSLGAYSARYAKPIWLWAAANSWGLSQASPDPGSVSDAVANGISLALLVRQGGGDLQGIVYWNYNVKEQGLYNDTHTTAYDVETMFSQVSAGLPRLRRLFGAAGGRPEVFILAPWARSHRAIGTSEEAIRLEVQPYHRLAMLATEGVNAAVVGSLQGWSLDGVRAVVVLSPNAEDLPRQDRSVLIKFLARGGKVLTSPGVGAVLRRAILDVPRENRHRTYQLLYNDLVKKDGNLYIAQKGIAVLFEDKRHELLIPFWQEVLGLVAPQPGYRVWTEEHGFHYHLGPEPATVRFLLPFEAIGYRYDDQARPVEILRGSVLTVRLDRREFVLLSRMRRSGLQIE